MPMNRLDIFSEVQINTVTEYYCQIRSQEAAMASKPMNMLEHLGMSKQILSHVIVLACNCAIIMLLQ